MSESNNNDIIHLPSDNDLFMTSSSDQSESVDEEETQPPPLVNEMEEDQVPGTNNKCGGSSRRSMNSKDLVRRGGWKLLMNGLNVWKTFVTLEDFRIMLVLISPELRADFQFD